MKKTILLAIGIILLVSCNKVIEFNGTQTNPKLVINSLVEVGQPVKASISKSVFFLDNEANTQCPDDLVATLYVNGNRYGEMTPTYDTLVSNDIWDPNDPSLGYVRKLYVSDYRPQVGDIIKITASANGFDDVEGTTSPLPKPVDCAVTDCKTLYWGMHYGENNGGETDSTWYVVFYTLELNVEITDPNPGQTDFFRLHVENGSEFADSVNYMSCYAQYDDPVFGATVANDYDIIDFSDYDLRPENVFTDVLFDGKTYPIKLTISVMLRNDGTVPSEFYSIRMEAEHLTKEYYNYLNTCNQGDETMQFFAEPIQTYSNVTNGYGIVGGRTVDSLSFPVPLSR